MKRQHTLGLVGLIIVVGAALVIFSIAHSSGKTQQAAVNAQDKNLVSNRILSLLPYYNAYFELTAQITGKNTNPNILFTYLPPPPGSNLPNSDEATAINNAKSWLTSKGVSLSQYHLINSATHQNL